mmetsp:Transcript_11021/g.16676  ORF Transcript_11021/g.16676 Transcript_11021/m.16676 type:complete len:238 (-) Transcript_11021:118-831(-)
MGANRRCSVARFRRIHRRAWLNHRCAWLSENQICGSKPRRQLIIDLASLTEHDPMITILDLHLLTHPISFTAGIDPLQLARKDEVLRGPQKQKRRVRGKRRHVIELKVCDWCIESFCPRVISPHKTVLRPAKCGSDTVRASVVARRNLAVQTRQEKGGSKTLKEGLDGSIIVVHKSIDYRHLEWGYVIECAHEGWDMRRRRKANVHADHSEHEFRIHRGELVPNERASIEDHEGDVR